MCKDAALKSVLPCFDGIFQGDNFIRSCLINYVRVSIRKINRPVVVVAVCSYSFGILVTQVYFKQHRRYLLINYI